MNEIRRLFNFFGGEVQENPLAASAVSMVNPAFVALPAVGATEHVPLTFDPDGIEGAPFVKWVTAHTAASDTVTITATGQELTTERAVSQGIPFVLAATRLDFATLLRVGGSATSWASGGTTIQPITGRVIEQFGASAAVNTTGANTITSFGIAFPVAFAQPPLVFLTLTNLTASAAQTAYVNTTPTTASFTVSIFNSGGAGTAIVNWRAIGEI